MNQRKLLDDRTAYILRVALILVMAVFMCALAYNNFSIWDDELFTLTAIDGTYKHLWDVVVADLVHPPLHYYLLKGFVDLFSTEHLGTVVLAKLFSVFWVVLLMILGSRILARRYGQHTALVFVLLLAGNTVVGYSVEIRMYSMALCATALAYLYANELVHEPVRKNWIWLTIWTVIGIYTNYFAAFALVFLWLVLLGWCWKQKRIKAWLFHALVCVILYLPWVITVLTNYGSITDYDTGLTVKRVIQFFAFPFSCHNDTVSMILILFTVILCVLILRASRKPEFFWVFLLNPIWIGVLCILSSFLFHKFITGRYLLPGWGAFWAGLAIGTARLKKNWFLPVLVLLDIASCSSVYLNETSDGKVMNAMLDYVEEHQPMLAESDVYHLLHYLKPEVILTENNDPDARGQRFVYYWSDLYTRLSESDIVMSFPLSVHEICVFTK